MAKKPQALTKWDAKLAELAKKSTRTVENIGAGGNMIGTAGGRFKYKGAVVPGNKMTVVIIDAINANLFYEDSYDPDNPTVPVCFAFGDAEGVMVPHEKSTDKQHADCKSCDNNQFGSADKGRGKACKNTVRLAIMLASDLDEDIARADVAYLHVPPTSLKQYAGYVRQIEDTLHRPPLGVVTNITITPDPKTQFQLVFDMQEKIDDGDAIEALLTKQEVVAKEIAFPYVQIENAAPAGKGKGKKAKSAKAGKYAR